MNLYLQIIIYCLVCILVIITYGKILCITNIEEFMTKSIFKGELSNYLDGWGISHFLFFAFLGYKFNKPKYILFCFILGVIWEIFEHFSKSKSHYSKYILNCKYDIKTDKGTLWWYGRYQDIIMNSLGLAFGYFISKKI